MLSSGRSKAEDKEQALCVLESLGVAQHAQKLPPFLSGGEQQRVAIARAIAHKPELLIADEPTGNLDEKNSELVSQLLVESCLEQNTSLVMVTHSNAVASITQHKLLLENGHLVNHEQ